MASVPGSAGISLLGDKSYEFYRDPIAFQQRHMKKTKSRVFLSRLLNKPTVFVGASEVLKEVLTEGACHLEMGYKQFMGEIYGDNILFTDGDMGLALRETLGHLFTPDIVKTYQDTIDRVTKKYISSLDVSQPVCVYKLFKKLAIEVCLGLFLGLDFNHCDAQIITDLTTTHWHGIISVPVSFKLPNLSESTYSKALEAKRKLLAVIQQRREEKCHSFTQHVERLPHLQDSQVNNHLLLLTSALVPKALSSILTSFVTELGHPEWADLQAKINESDDCMDQVLLEVLRLYPPFIGGRRIVTKEFTAGGYRFPADHAILYLTYAAQRDPAVYENPDEFKPERWQGSYHNERNSLFCFGSGTRNCLGEQLVWNIVKTVIRELVSQFKFVLEPDQDLTHKWLPVSRPRGNVLVKFEPRSPQGSSEPSSEPQALEV